MTLKKTKTCAALAAILLVGTAQADIIEVTDIALESNATITYYDRDTDSVVTVSDPDAGTNSVSSSARFGDRGFNQFEEIVGVFNANATAFNNGFFSTDASVFDIGSAEANLVQRYTVKNTSDSAQAVTFDFAIEEGQLVTQCNDDFFDFDGPFIARSVSPPNGANNVSSQQVSCANYNQSASYLANITAGGNTLFNSFTKLESVAGAQQALVQEGTELERDTNVLQGEDRFAWAADSFTGDLGVLQAGQSIELIYTVNIDSIIANIDPTVFVIPDFDNELGFLNFNTGGNLTDPFGFSSLSFTTTLVNGNPGSEPVSAPATLAMFGLSLFGLVAARRKFKQA